MNSDQNLSKPLGFGPVRPECRAVLAPMSGISDVAFRRLAARFGAGMVVTEMVAARGYLASSQEATLRAEGAGMHPHIVQLVGRDPGTMGEAARLAEANGADMVDINFGCPAKKVTGALCGSALMQEPALALAIVRAVVAAVRVPVTVKMRLGWDSTTLNAPELARQAEQSGVRGFTVHGRTRQQFYTGQADWGLIGDTVRAVAGPVIANGDVVDAATARACLSRSGAAAVMIGRAALGQPWIVGQIGAALDDVPYRAPTWAERAAAAVEHYETLLQIYGRQMGVRHARKHLAAYAERASEAGFGLSASERTRLVIATEPAEVTALLTRLYDEPQRRAA